MGKETVGIGDGEYAMDRPVPYPCAPGGGATASGRRDPVSTRQVRRVHARTDAGSVIVRYDRAGVWYLEYPHDRMIPARKLRLTEAVSLATAPGSTVYLGEPGGRRFDAAVRRSQTERDL